MSYETAADNPPEPEQFDGAGKRLPLVCCAACGHALDAATCTYGDATRPNPGDISVCIHCAEISVYTPDMTLRAASVTDLLHLDEAIHRQIEKAQWAIRAARSERSK